MGKSIENKYMGMSEEQLNLEQQQCEMYIRQQMEDIEDYKVKIGKSMAVIKATKKKLQKIQEAKQEVKNINYITMMQIYKRSSSVLKKGCKLPQYISNYKDYVEYRFDIQKCNKQNYRYATKFIATSKGFMSWEKEKFTQEIIKAIKDYDVTLVVIEEGTAVATTQIKKYCSNIIKEKNS